MLYQSQLNNNTEDLSSSKPLYSLERCTEHALQVLDSGKALKKFRQMLLAQGADPAFLSKALDTPNEIPLASFVSAWTCETAGYVHDIPAKTMGDISVMIGAGRMVAGQPVDAQAGLVFSTQVGDKVDPGDVVVQVYTNQSQEQSIEVGPGGNHDSSRTSDQTHRANHHAPSNVQRWDATVCHARFSEKGSLFMTKVISLCQIMPRIIIRTVEV